MDKQGLAHLGHDLWIRLSHGVGPLHSDRVPPHLHLAAHEAASGLRGRLVVLVLQEAEASVLLLVIRLVVQYHLLEALCREDEEATVTSAVFHNEPF